MTKVIAYDGKIDASLEKGAGATVAKHVRRYSFRECRVYLGGGFDVFGEDVACSVAGKRSVPDSAECRVGRVCRNGII